MHYICEKDKYKSKSHTRPPGRPTSPQSRRWLGCCQTQTTGRLTSFCPTSPRTGGGCAWTSPAPTNSRRPLWLGVQRMGCMRCRRRMRRSWGGTQMSAHRRGWPSSPWPWTPLAAGTNRRSASSPSWAGCWRGLWAVRMGSRCGTCARGWESPWCTTMWPCPWPGGPTSQRVRWTGIWIAEG